MAEYARKCTGYSRKSNGHPSNWQDMFVHVQHILANLVVMLVDFKTLS